MYGLNNNTGIKYSQQDNNFERLGRKITSAKAGERIMGHIIKSMSKL